MAKLKHGEISSKRGLFAFFANNSKSNISLHYHGNIIATISNTGNSLASEMLNILGNNSLLGWTATTNADRLCILRNTEELIC
jgi:hypothetical protein